MPTSCNQFCISKKCFERKKCACNCGKLKAVNSALHKSCVDQCWTNQSIGNLSIEQFICENVSPQIAFNNHGYVCPGFNPITGTAQGIAQKENLKAAGGVNTTPLLFGGLLLGGILLFILFR